MTDQSPSILQDYAQTQLICVKAVQPIIAPVMKWDHFRSSKHIRQIKELMRMVLEALFAHLCLKKKIVKRYPVEVYTKSECNVRSFTWAKVLKNPPVNKRS